MDQNKSWSLGFEFLDIEIIDHKNENQEAGRKWNCDQCRLFFLSKEKLSEHKKKHLSLTEEVVRCKYCNKVLSAAEGSKDCYSNGKCETCEYRCSRCPQRFLRRSSLINHEKNHVLLNKKKKKIALGNKRKIKKIQPANGLNVKNLRKKRRAKTVTEIVEHHSSVKGNVQSNPIGISPKKKRKLQSEKLVADTSVTLNSSEKISNRSSVKSSKPKEVDTPVNNMKNKANNVTPTSTPPARPITPASENVVNYKPFSCHVCGDNFASDNALLQHIESHGGNAAKVFRCKHCGDEFGDIYKMQYHLAICPLAEDELESALKLKQAIPRGMKIKMSNQKSAPGVSNGTPLVRKRGRPRKYPIVNSDQTNESTDKDFTPSPSTRSGIRKRKLEEFPSSVNASHKMSSSPISKRAKRRTDEHDPDDFGNEYSTDCVEEDVGDLETNPNENSDEKKVHSCPFPRCGIKFSREKALLCHMRNHNDDFEDVLKCHKCDIPFDDLQSLRTHIDVCKGIKEEKDDDFDEPTHGENDNSSEKSFQRSRGSFMCKICGRTYATKDKLNSHNCHGANPLSMKFNCRLCGAEVKSQQLLKEHFQLNHPNSLQFQCSTCLLEFDQLKEVMDHIFFSHLRESFECAVCLEKMESKSELQKHYFNAHPGLDRNKCQICNRIYSDPSGLAKHRHVHTGERPYKCPFCPMAFTLKSSQVVHIRRHTNYRPYKCNTCPKTFFNSGDLRKHTRSHTGEKPYSCGICKKSFSLRESLNGHLKKHRKVLPFKCPECPRAFNDKTLLKHHLPIHSGIRPLQCPLCTQSYFVLGSLRTHIRHTHIERHGLVFMCQLCQEVKGSVFEMANHLLSHIRDQIPHIGERSNFPKDSKNTQSGNFKKKRGRPRKIISDVDYIPKRGQKRKIKRSSKSTIIRKRNGKTNFTKPKFGIIDDQQSKTPVDLPSMPTGLTTKISTMKTVNANNGGIFEFVSIKIEEPDTPDELEEGVDVKEELGCTMCREKFSCHEHLLEHVYIHI